MLLFAQESGIASISSESVSAERGKPALLTIRSQRGSWRLNAHPTAQIDSGQAFWVHRVRDGFKIRQGDDVWLMPSDRPLEIISQSDSSVADVFWDESMRRISGSLEVYSHRNAFAVVAQIPLEDYVAGVVEAEVGHVPWVEFLAAQAVVARSYVLAKQSKLQGPSQGSGLFSEANWQVTDGVADQVFRGLPWGVHRDSIRRAVENTRGWVMLTSDGAWFTAAFHSNSGGHTVPSEDAWSRPLEQLRGVVDTFSLRGDHARWEQRVSCEAWERYLLDVWGDSVRAGAAEVFWLMPLSEVRQRYVEQEGARLDLVQMRRDWRWNSTWFHIDSCFGDSLLIRGRGFGHGVGMSQEGGMQMALQGYSWQEILLYYYSDMELRHLSELKRL